ncbi:MAG: iron-containing alcohol dehydrogenase, partial [Oscillospiraceae bacterium]|nr:iron-containing alcohol dehydrogenase [Oscillospiraceae bacterium]
MQTVMVNASASYPVHIGEGLLDRAGELIADITKSRRCAIVTDSSVGPLYGGRVRDSLKKAGFDVLAYTFPAGERNKNLDNYGKMLEFFALGRLTRSDFVVALGGGVTGDMAGFAAATYQR